ncbi:MAG: hypothetical protein BYD32DRAFT_490529 [Podila humilis]|nr:MAG: hypothetical protein BYD32DRAFT_490529 [Podila humilis]
MVKLSLSFLSITTAFAAVASAAPFCAEVQLFDLVPANKMNKELESFGDNQCVPEVNIREYHPFQLKSSNLDSLLSKHIKSNLLVGGFKDGNKNFEQLEFCIVSSDHGCSTTIQSACIYENVEYRFRVNGPVQGYLHIEDEQLRIVSDFKDASNLNLYKEAGWGLRVAHLNTDGSRSVLETTSAGRAVILTEFEKDNSRQWFQIIKSSPYEHSRW